MPSVDQRVVQMVFDKGNFESAVKSVMNTLNNLKKNLNLDKASKEFDKISEAAKEVDLSYIANGVDQLNARFSNMGVVGMSVLNNLTNAAINAGKKMVGTLTSSIIQGGKRRALNLEQAKFQIEGLGYTWDQVSKDIDYGVQDTAYGLDAAARAAGQLLASNVQVGDDLKNSLRGISGVAAMTNSTYEDIADVFITVAGNGRLMGSELTRLSARGINAAATLAKYLNTSEAEVREMTSKGKIDFQTFANAMDSTFGDHAKKANEIFSGALSNMKAALSRIGANFATPAYEHMRIVLISLIALAKQVQAVIQPLVTSAANGMAVVSGYLTWALSKITQGLGSEGAKGAMEQINKIIVALGTSLWNLYRDVRNIVRPIGEAFLEAFGGTLLDVLVRVTQGIEEFTRSLALNARMEENLKKTFVGIFTVLAAVLDVISTVVGTVAGVLSTTIVNVFGFFLDILLNVTAFLGDVVLKIKEFVEWVLKLEIVKTIMETISNAFQVVAEFIGDAFNAMRDFVNQFLDSAFEGAIDIFNNIGVAVQNLSNWLKEAWGNLVNWINTIRELPIVQGTIERINKTFATIGEKISKAASVVKSSFITAFTTARDAISNFISVLRELIGEYVQLPSLQEAVAGFQQFIVDTFNSSKDIFEFVKEVVKGIIERVRELAGENFNKFLENLSAVRDRIIEIVKQVNTLEGLKTAISNVGNFFKGFADTSNEFINKVKDNLTEFVEWVKTKVSGITLGEVIAAGAAGSFMAFFIQAARFLGEARKVTMDWGKFFGEFQKIPGNINKVLKNIGKQTEYDKAKERIKAITELVKATALLAGALMLLSNVDPVRLITSAAVIGGLMAALVLLSTHMAKTTIVGKGGIAQAFSAMGTQLLALAGAVAILAVALRMISKMNTADLVKSVVAIGVLMAELALASRIIGKRAKYAANNVGNILALAGAMALMAGAIALMSMIPAENLFKAITALSVLITITALASKVAGTADKGAFAAILGIALAMNGMVLALKMVASMTNADFIGGILRMVTVVGMMVILMRAASLAGQYAAGAGAAILGMSAAFLLIGISMRVLGSISSGELQNAMQTLMALTIVFAVMAAITRLAGKNGASAGIAIAAMSGSLILIAAAIAILAQIDPAGLDRAVDAIEGLMFMFAIVIAATNLARQAQKTIVYITIAVMALAGAIAVLSLLDPANVAVAALAIDSIMLCFALLLSVGEVAKGALKSAYLMLGVVAVLAGVIAALTLLDPQGSMQVALGLSALLISLSAALAVCAAVGAVGPAALIGIGMMFAAFLAVVSLMTLIAGTADLAQSIIDKAIPVLISLANGLGTAIGAFIGGVLGSASNALVTVGENLVKFGEAFSTFSQSVSGLDDSAMHSIETLVAMVAILAGADLVNNLIEFFGGSTGGAFDSLCENLPKLGEAMSKFSQALGDTDTEALSKAADAGKALAEMANALPKEGGFFEAIFGTTTNMDTFGDQLVSYGKALKNFGDVAKDVNVEDINKILGPTETLIDLSNRLDNVGGIISFWAGDNDFATFGENLAEYGDSLVEFSNSLGDVKYDQIEKALGPTETLIAIGKKLNDNDAIGGLFNAGLFGDTSLGGFGSSLAVYGDKLRTFAGYISEISDEDIEAMGKIGDLTKLFAEAANIAPGKSVFSYWAGGENQLESIGEQLPTLGDGLAKFSEYAKDIDSEAIQASIPAIKAAAEIAEAVPNMGGILGVLFGEATNMTIVGSQLPALGQGLAIYSVYAKSIDSAAVEGSVPAIRALKDVVGEISGIFGNIFNIAGGIASIFMFPLLSRSIGAGLNAFASTLSGVDTGAAAEGAQAAKYLAEAVDNMPGLDTLIAKVAGDLTGNTFESYCTTLANGLKAFSEATSDVNTSKITATTNAMKTLAEFASTSADFYGLKAIGENIQDFTNYYKIAMNQLTQDEETVNKSIEVLNKILSSLKEFAENIESTLAPAGEKLNQVVSDIISGITNVFISNEENVYNAAFGMVNKINTAISEASSGTAEKARSIGTNIVNNLAGAMRDNGDAVGQATLFIIQWAIDTLEGKSGEFNTQGQNLMNQLAEGLSYAGVNVKNAVMTILIDVETYIRSRQQTFFDLGKSLMTKLCEGIKAGSSAIRSAVQAALRSATSGIDTSNFRSLGENAGNSLAAGLRSKIIAVTSAAQDLGRAASLGASSALQIHSPSKVFRRIGMYVGEGFEQGLDRSTHGVELHATRLANSAVSAMAIVADIIEDTIDSMEYSPKITPVVDSSQILSGMNNVNSMFGSPYGNALASRALGQMNANSLAMLQNQNGINQMTNMLESKIDDLTDAVVGLYNLNPEFNMYLDGKQFASSVARPMNRELGKIYKRGGIT